MAGLSVTGFAKQNGMQLAFDDDADATVVTNLDGGPTTLNFLYCDNNALASIVYMHVWNAGNPVIGTDPADHQFPVPASGRQEIIFVNGQCDVGLSYAVTTDKGTTANTSPGTPPNLYLKTNGGAS